MKKQSSIWVFFALVFIVPATAFAIVNWYEKKIKKLPVYYSIAGKGADNTGFLSQENQPLELKDMDGKIVVVSFFFTHCPTICPKLTSNMGKVQDAFLDDPAVLIASFSVDPERDSASELNKYAAAYKVNAAKWKMLTGNKKDIYRLARNNFRVVATDGDGGPDDFIHTEKFVLVDKLKRIRGYYDGTDNREVKQLISDIKRLTHEN